MASSQPFSGPQVSSQHQVPPCGASAPTGVEHGAPLTTGAHSAHAGAQYVHTHFQYLSNAHAAMTALAAEGIKRAFEPATSAEGNKRRAADAASEGWRGDESHAWSLVRAQHAELAVLRRTYLQLRPLSTLTELPLFPLPDVEPDGMEVQCLALALERACREVRIRIDYHRRLSASHSTFYPGRLSERCRTDWLLMVDCMTMLHRQPSNHQAAVDECLRRSDALPPSCPAPVASASAPGIWQGVSPADQLVFDDILEELFPGCTAPGPYPFNHLEIGETSGEDHEGGVNAALNGSHGEVTMSDDLGLTFSGPSGMWVEHEGEATAWLVEGAKVGLLHARVLWRIVEAPGRSFRASLAADFAQAATGKGLQTLDRAPRAYFATVRTVAAAVRDDIWRRARGPSSLDKAIVVQRAAQVREFRTHVRSVWLAEPGEAERFVLDSAAAYDRQQRSKWAFDALSRIIGITELNLNQVINSVQMYITRKGVESGAPGEWINLTETRSRDEYEDEGVSKLSVIRETLDLHVASRKRGGDATGNDDGAGGPGDHVDDEPQPTKGGRGGRKGALVKKQVAKERRKERRAAASSDESSESGSLDGPAQIGIVKDQTLTRAAHEGPFDGRRSKTIRATSNVVTRKWRPDMAAIVAAVNTILTPPLDHPCCVYGGSFPGPFLNFQKAPLAGC